jgi:hypothetical protein
MLRNPKEAPIRDGAKVRLQMANTARFVDVDQSGAVTTVSGRARSASTLVIYKADVPDATDPQTCDSIIRDGDYVFLRDRRPAAWLAPDRAGGLQAGP